MRTVEVSTVLEADASEIWQAVTRPTLLCHVAAPILWFPALARRVDSWQQGEDITTWLLFFGVIPVSRHHMRVLEVHPEERRIATHEWGGIVRRWDHTIWIEPLGLHAPATPTESASTLHQ